jgi:hypothetical protein
MAEFPDSFPPMSQRDSVSLPAFIAWQRESIGSAADSSRGERGGEPKLSEAPCHQPPARIRLRDRAMARRVRHSQGRTFPFAASIQRSPSQMSQVFAFCSRRRQPRAGLSGIRPGPSLKGLASRTSGRSSTDRRISSSSAARSRLGASNAKPISKRASPDAHESGPCWARTNDLEIKSLLLYQLS